MLLIFNYLDVFEFQFFLVHKILNNIHKHCTKNITEPSSVFCGLQTSTFKGHYSLLKQKTHILSPQSDLVVLITNPACMCTDGSVDPRSRSVIGCSGAKLYSGKWVGASETRG